MHLAVVVLAATIGSAVLAARANAPRPVRVFLFTAAPTGQFDPREFKRRADSVNDLRNELVKQPGVELADGPESADLLIELLSSALVFSRSDSAQAVETVKVRVMAGRDTVFLRGSASPDAYAGWKDAASHTCAAVVKWINEHRDRLIDDGQREAGTE